MRLQESGEMYLETMYILSKEKRNIRAVDVGERMGFSKPSVSRAMGLLREGGYVITDEDGFLRLTPKGLAAAERTYERHEVLTECFRMLGVPQEHAEEDACRVEHILSEETFAAIKEHVRRSKACNS